VNKNNNIEDKVKISTGIMKIMLVVAALITLTPSFSHTQDGIVSYQESYEDCKRRVENNTKMLEDAGYVFTKEEKRCKVKYQCLNIPCRQANK